MILKPLGSFIEHLLDPATAFSEEPNESVFARANQTDLAFYDYLGLPGHETVRKRCGTMMAVTGHADESVARQGPLLTYITRDSSIYCRAIRVRLGVTSCG